MQHGKSCGLPSQLKIRNSVIRQIIKKIRISYYSATFQCSRQDFLPNKRYPVRTHSLSSSCRARCNADVRRCGILGSVKWPYLASADTGYAVNGFGEVIPAADASLEKLYTPGLMPCSMTAIIATAKSRAYVGVPI